MKRMTLRAMRKLSEWMIIGQVYIIAGICAIVVILAFCFDWGTIIDQLIYGV